MSQFYAVRAMDALILEELLAVGGADRARYELCDEDSCTSAPCIVLVDRAAQFFGEVGDVAGRRVTVTLFLEQVSSPVRGAKVHLLNPSSLPTGEVFRLSEEDLRDESMSRWVVVNG